ncbi:MAG: NADH:ubiquinone oxidoreductase subunit N, partial [Burkholderiaceae bacterium]|nr:NADH:ubiquinone oxidoreductase subunit N [Burkholderiaceae bacterium]
MDSFDLIAIAPELVLITISCLLLVSSAFVKEAKGGPEQDVFHAPRAASYVYSVACLLLIGLGAAFITRIADLP